MEIITALSLITALGRVCKTTRHFPVNCMRMTPCVRFCPSSEDMPNYLDDAQVFQLFMCYPNSVYITGELEVNKKLMSQQRE